MDYSKIAHVYDAYVMVDFDVPFFRNEAKNCRHVLELMAGTGRVSIPLVEAGISLTCVDNSKEMLNILREKLESRGLSAAIHEMDVRDLSLSGTLDLIILPFHSFSEILTPLEQRRALSAIRAHLSDTGRFICTLHNPPLRLESVNGRVKHYGTYPLPENAGTLVLSAIEHYDPDNHNVSGTQNYELYDADGVMTSKHSLDIRFYLHEKDEFQALVQSEGFSILDLFGDYSYSAFEADKSPFMIWVLGTGKRKRYPKTRMAQFSNPF